MTTWLAGEKYRLETSNLIRVYENQTNYVICNFVFLECGASFINITYGHRVVLEFKFNILQTSRAAEKIAKIYLLNMAVW